MNSRATSALSAQCSCTTNLRPASLVLAGLLLAQGAYAADCDSERHRQFDFWVGKWRVENPSGEVVGDNHIERILDGCALHENWQGGKDYNGQSLNTWDAASGQWRQFWTDNHGLTLHLSGGWREDRMVLEGSRRDEQGRTVTDRITWIPLADGIVRQHWQQAVDGAEFKTVFDGRYVPADRPDDSD